MRVMCKPGSVGGLGGRPPRSTRPRGPTGEQSPGPPGLFPSPPRSPAASDWPSQPPGNLVLHRIQSKLLFHHLDEDRRVLGGRIKTVRSFSRVRSSNTTVSLCSRRSRMNHRIRSRCLRSSASVPPLPKPRKLVETRLEPQSVLQLNRYNIDRRSRPAGSDSPFPCSSKAATRSSSRRRSRCNGSRRSCTAP